MNYKNVLQKQISDLQQKIETYQGEKLELIKELNRLRLAEVQETERENSQQLLKG